MKRRILNFLIVAGAICFTTAVLASAAEKVLPPDEVVIENQGYSDDKKGGVKLSHKKHSDPTSAKGFGVGCAECHHEYKDGKNVWTEEQPVKKCAECHDPTKDQDTAKKLQTAYHNNCKNCHKDLIKEKKSKDAPYKKCNDCHAKK